MKTAAVCATTKQTAARMQRTETLSALAAADRERPSTQEQDAETTERIARVARERRNEAR